jgi:copper(I)-binding protein
MVLLAACGGGSSLEVNDAWARESASTQNAGAAYFTISGGDTDDRIVGISVDEGVAAVAELHETAMVVEDDDTGMMMMEPVDAIAVPADGEVRFEPGGYHVMLMQLTEPFAVGDEFSLTLQFEDAGDVVVQVTVEDR